MDEGNGFSGANPTNSAGTPTPDLNSAQATQQAPVISNPEPSTALDQSTASPAGIYTPNFTASPDSTQPVTGDIILDVPKKPRKWLIPAIIVVVVALIVGGAALLITSLSNRPAPATLESTFSHFQKLLKEGPDNLELNTTENEAMADTSDIDTSLIDSETEDEDQDNLYNTGDETTSTEPSNTDTEAEADDNTSSNPSDDWFIFRIDEYDLSHDQAMSYYHELLASYDEFAQFATETGRATDTLATYPPLLKAVVDINMLDDLSDQIMLNVANDGSEKTYHYIQTILPEESELAIVNLVREQLEVYFTAQLSAGEIYVQHDCYRDGGFDSDCQTNLIDNDSEMQEIFSKTTENQNLFSRYSPALIRTFVARTSALEENFGVVNDAQD